MESASPVSVIGRLVDELSWAGSSIRRLRNGGRGDENVLTAEVMLLLSLLPRTAFLGAVILAAHGAEKTRALLATDLEQATVQMFPDEITIPRTGVRVQPDAAIWTDSAAVLIEAKGTRTAAQFQKTQLAREYLALMTDSRKHKLLLVIMASTPPVRIQSAGRIDLFEGVTIGLEELCSAAALTASDVEHLVQAIPETVCWITWQEIRSIVAEAAATYPCIDASLAGTLRRLTQGVTDAIDWHSGAEAVR
ncbi:hypothetical protein GCM10023063_19940 [Arthrobacter methylotrophus]|uniref:Uncharacterized protein n=1 Tax=Arthrobacter methylotrophus TaxID=121291 RepID=A0ABV5UPF7_9MICC